MKIAFVSEIEQNDIGGFSGTPYYMSRALDAFSEYFEYIHSPVCDWKIVERGGKSGEAELKRIGAFVTDKLKSMPVDVVICQGSSMIPYLNTHIPIVLWHDSTWFSWKRIGFSEFKNRYNLLYVFDQRVLKKCDLIVFSADWIREQTLNYYDISPDKINVVSYGANIDSISRESAEKFIVGRSRTPCELTIVAKDWKLKGLPLAYLLMKELNHRGLESRLNVIGCEVEKIGLKRKLMNCLGLRYDKNEQNFQKEYNKNKTINKVGFLRKNVPSERQQFYEILQRSHFLIHPASFDSSPIALPEANAFGVPVLALNCYGPKTIIRDGANGHLFGKEDFVEHAANFIETKMADYARYQEIARNSFQEYEQRLNWSIAVKRLTDLISSRF